MKKLVEILTNPMLLSIIGLVALAIIIWFGGPLIAISDSKPLETESNRLIAILIVTILWGLNNFRVQNANKKKDADMMGDIASASPKKNESAEESEEAKAIQQHFTDALKILKASKKQKSGKAAAIHELPWYIIIGPPGSGKTTALMNSGLRFPLADKMGQQPLKGIGGTRNCDWWFSDDAILIDTAGRYTTQDSDRENDSSQWNSFLKLLKKHRPRQPINGAIVAISLGELLTQSETERQEHAQLIKQRLQELYDNLGIQFPVYVILTKTDLIAGFNEFFDNLSKPEREQVFGTTFPANESFESQYDSNFFKEQFDSILRGLNSRLQWRLHEERDLSRRALILNFPAELSSIKEMINQFLDFSFKPTNFDKPVNLRGIYFTSGTQEGTPIDRVMGAMATNFGLNRQTIPTYSGQGKSFFLTQLFRNVVFPESVIAGTNRLYEQKQTWTRRIAYVAALVITITSVGVWTSNYTAITKEMDALATQIEDYNNKAAALPEKIDNPAILLPSLEILLNASTTISSENRGLFSQAGLSQMRSLGPASDEAYIRALQQQYYPALVAILEESLNDRTVALETLFIHLKTYLMLADKSRLNKKEVTQWFAKRWENEFAGNDAKQKVLKGHLARLFEQDIDTIETNKNLVAQVRVKLQKIPLSQRIYGALKQKGSTTLQDFFISDVLDTQEQQIFLNKDNEDQSIKGVPGLFTKEGYESYFREESVKFAKASTQDDWVFGKSDNKNIIDPDKIHKNIETLYVKDFIKHWDKLFNSIKIAKFKTIEHGVDQLEVLGGDNPAITRIIDSININTNLRSKPNLLQQAGADKLKKLGKLGKKASKKVKSDIPLTPVGVKLRKHYSKQIALTDTTGDKPPGLQKHIVSISKLQTYLNEIMVSAEPNAAALQASVTRMKTNGKDIIGKLRRDSKRIPKPFNSWIKGVTANSWQIILNNSRTYINENWTNEILVRFDRSLKSKYPIYKNSTQQTSIEDFTDFFAPEGHYFTFLESNIFPFIKTKGKTWSSKTLEGQSIGFSKTTISQLQKGFTIGKAFFSRSSDTVNVKFQLKPTSLDANAKRVTLNFDGEKFIYRHGPPRAKSFTWPFSDSPEGSKVSIRFDSGSNKIGVRKSGTWALFQLLDEASVKSSGSADKFNVNFKIEDLYVKYSLKASSVSNPFSLNTVHSFRPPKRL